MSCTAEQSQVNDIHQFDSEDARLQKILIAASLPCKIVEDLTRWSKCFKRSHARCWYSTKYKAIDNPIVFVQFQVLIIWPRLEWEHWEMAWARLWALLLIPITLYGSHSRCSVPSTLIRQISLCRMLPISESYMTKDNVSEDKTESRDLRIQSSICHEFSVEFVKRTLIDEI